MTKLDKLLKTKWNLMKLKKLVKYTKRTLLAKKAIDFLAINTKILKVIRKGDCKISKRHKFKNIQ